MADISFVTTLPITVFIRPRITPPPDWQDYERGPGYIGLPADHDLGIRARMLNDDSLRLLVNEIKDLPNMIYLNLAENRGISSEGLEVLKTLRGLTILNLSSVDLTNTGLPHLLALPRLTHLDLSYCNRITDTGLKTLRGLENLVTLNLQGCVKISHGGITRISRRGLTVRK